MPELVGVHEIADLLGLSKQRVHQLAWEDSFPEPVAELRMGRVWNLGAVRRWAKRVGRL